jgi:hypothetical protein
VHRMPPGRGSSARAGSAPCSRAARPASTSFVFANAGGSSTIVSYCFTPIILGAQVVERIRLHEIDALRALRSGLRSGRPGERIARRVDAVTLIGTAGQVQRERAVVGEAVERAPAATAPARGGSPAGPGRPRLLPGPRAARYRTFPSRTSSSSGTLPCSSSTSFRQLLQASHRHVVACENAGRAHTSSSAAMISHENLQSRRQQLHHQVVAVAVHDQRRQPSASACIRRYAVASGASASRYCTAAATRACQNAASNAMRSRLTNRSAICDVGLHSAVPTRAPASSTTCTAAGWAAAGRTTHRCDRSTGGRRHASARRVDSLSSSASGDWSPFVTFTSP